MQFSAESEEEFDVNIDDLHDLAETQIPGVEDARRPIDQEQKESLVLSNPREWPPILVTRAEGIGLVIIDGYHRKEAAIIKGMKQIRATSRAYENANDVVEACFQANVKHGLRSSAENRSKYAYWLHKTYPDMPQDEIARRAGIKQSTVSKAIARREESKKRAERTPANEQHEHIRRDCERLTNDAVKLVQDISALPEQEQRVAIAESLQRVEDREALLKVAMLLEEILKPRAARRRRPAAAAH